MIVGTLTTRQKIERKIRRLPKIGISDLLYIPLGFFGTLLAIGGLTHFFQGMV